MWLLKWQESTVAKSERSNNHSLALTIYRRQQTSPPLCSSAAARAAATKCSNPMQLLYFLLSCHPGVSPTCNQTHVMSVQSISPAAHSHHKIICSTYTLFLWSLSLSRICYHFYPTASWTSIMRTFLSLFNYLPVQFDLGLGFCKVVWRTCINPRVVHQLHIDLTNTGAQRFPEDSTDSSLVLLFTIWHTATQF